MKWVAYMKKILIVEDDTKLREELKILLEHHGYVAKIQTNFETVLDDVMNQAYDLILLDIHLPENSGLHILKEIRLKSNVPIMMVTSQNTEIDEVVGMSYGADEKVIDKALFRQIAIFFLFPLILAMIHSIFGIIFCNYILETFGNEKLLESIILTATFLITIYGGYFILTYLCSKNIIREK